MRTRPWGSSATELPTDYTYTGQQQEYEIGLSYYVARWYDPYLNHFTQSDTIIPDPYNPASWNRYAYVNYNPIKFIDPSGHAFTPPNRNLAMTDGGNNLYYSSGPYTPTASTSEVAKEENNIRYGEIIVTFKIGRDSPPIVDYYSDSLSDPVVTSGPGVFEDFLLRYQTLLPFEKRFDDTAFVFGYSISDTQFIIEYLYSFTSYAERGTPKFDVIYFQSGFGSIVEYLSGETLVPYSYQQLIDEPLVFSTENCLNMDINIRCYSCYDYGSGIESITWTRYVTIIMGRNLCPYREGAPLGGDTIFVNP